MGPPRIHRRYLGAERDRGYLAGDPRLAIGR
jgi:hypothetical protein